MSSRQGSLVVMRGHASGTHLCVVDGKVGKQAPGQVLGRRVQHLLVQQQQLVRLLLLLFGTHRSLTSGKDSGRQDTAARRSPPPPVRDTPQPHLWEGLRQAGHSSPSVSSSSSLGHRPAFLYLWGLPTRAESNRGQAAPADTPFAQQQRLALLP